MYSSLNGFRYVWRVFKRRYSWHSNVEINVNTKGMKCPFLSHELLCCFDRFLQSHEHSRREKEEVVEQEVCRELNSRYNTMAQMERGKVTIVGSGLIGRSWAVIFARSGHPVVLYDTDAAQIESALNNCRSQLEDMESKGSLHGIGNASTVLQNISGSNTLKDALKDAIYVQECVPENLDLKKKVFKNLDAETPANVILASSTSCLMPSLFTEDLQNRQRCLVAHPINPPYYIPLVEIIPAPWTSPEVIQSTRTLMSNIKQAPVVAKKEVNGFILNRLQYAVIMEAWRLVEEGICSPEDVDTTVTEGLGLRYALIGPFQTMHLNANGMIDYCNRYGKSIEGVCQEQCEPRALEGNTLKVVAEAMEKRIPLDALEKARQQRDAGLAKLAEVKHGMGAKEGSSSK